MAGRQDIGSGRPGIPEPFGRRRRLWDDKDFDAYWKKQIARLKDVPVEVLDCKELPSKNPKVKLYAIAVRAPGRAVQPPTAKAKDVERVTGYLSDRKSVV